MHESDLCTVSSWKTVCYGKTIGRGFIFWQSQTVKMKLVPRRSSDWQSLDLFFWATPQAVSGKYRFQGEPIVENRFYINVLAAL